MAITIIERRTCDWCENDDGEESVVTHRIVFDRLAREVELHDACQAEATLAHLLDKGRKPTPAQIAQASGVPQIKCPVKGCPKYGTGSMGLAQHLARSHGDIPDNERRAMYQNAGEGQST